MTFLFQTGSIRSPADMLPCTFTFYYCFYSKLVRLEGLVFARLISWHFKFLFQTGSIRRIVFTTLAFAKTCFYSKLVRLEVLILAAVLTDSSFLFQTGSIRSVGGFRYVVFTEVSIPNWFD